jgi:RNA polymerase primary sigma factor
LRQDAAPGASDGRDRDSTALSAYLERIGRIPLPDAETEVRLASLARAGDATAYAKLAEANLRLVVHIASRYAGKGVALRELISAGNEGLMRAVRTFEARPEARFANYAVWWIRRHILRSIVENGRAVRIPLHRLPLLAAIRTARDELFYKTGREPSPADIAELLGEPVSKIVPLVACGSKTASLQSPVGSDESGGVELGDLIGDDSASDPGAECLRAACAGELRRLVGQLGKRDADILRKRFGLDDGESRTCEDIGREYGLTRERVRQIQDKALRRIRREYEELSRPRDCAERRAGRLLAARREVIAEFSLRASVRAT